MLFLANENFPFASVEQLRRIGHDLHAVADLFPGAADRRVLLYAAENQRIILTFDKDYGGLIYLEGGDIPLGVVLFRFVPTTPLEPAERLLDVLGMPNISLYQRFTILERGRARQRPLPHV